MKYICIILIYIFMIIVPSFGQEFQKGKLYIKVNDPVGIPDIEIRQNDTLIAIEKDSLLQVFQLNHVYAFRRSFPVADEMRSARKHGLDKVYTIFCDCDEEKLMQDMLQASGNIYSYVERIPIYQAASNPFTPDDYHLQDPYPATGPDSALSLIRAKEAWGYTHGDSLIRIGILDMNLLKPSFWNHEDINGKIELWDTINNNLKWGFHGLFVAGTAAGNTDNGTGKSSIGFNCKMMFSSNFPDTGMLTLSRSGSKVLNVSLAFPESTNTGQSIINTVTDNGTLVVSAAGNYPDAFGSFNVRNYPASYSNVFSVTSIDYNDHFDTWDTLTGAFHYVFNDSVDICAPGYHVLGLWDSCDTCYKRSSGTSFASPLVAGTAGLIYSINPCLRPADVTHILKSTANDTIYQITQNQPYLNKLGAGRLDAGRALQLTDSLYKPVNYSIENGQNITWDDPKYIAETIVIEPGGLLTIRSRVVLNPNAVITVQRGGKLIVDGGILTSGCACRMWSGIDVWGNRDASQYSWSNQGVVVFQNGALIENAKVAVRTMRPTPSDEEWAWEQDYTGGIVIGINATFRNNQKAVWFLPYENHHPITNQVADNYGYFSLCTFETNDTLVNEELNPATFADLEGVRGIKFNGCTFRNTQSAMVDRKVRGNGINSINSSFYVREYCLDEFQPCEHEKPCLFYGLNYGIKALGTETTKAPYIDKSTFTNNATGIYLSAIEAAMIIRDTFNVKPITPGLCDTMGGLYLNECAKYTVEENWFESTFSLFPPTTLRSVGIAVNNSNIGSYSNLDNSIYNNRFERLYTGILAMNRNRNNTGWNGLEIKCNDFISPMEYDIAVTKDDDTATYMGIRYNQGSAGIQATSPAGNTFSYTWNNNFSDYFNDGENIQYWYHAYSGGANVEPINYSSSVFPLANPNNPYPYSKSSGCPSNLISGGGIEDFILEKNIACFNIDSVSGLLSFLVDGGDTPGTVSTVVTSNGSQTLQVRDDLLEKTPYLSDSVMVSVAQKEDVLPSAVITEIMTANPQSAKSDDVLTALENRYDPLTTEQFEAIEAGRFVAGAREVLESKLAGYRLDYNDAMKRILQHYRNDTLNPSAGDSIRWYLANENTLPSAYTLSFEYLLSTDTSQAQSLVNSIPENFSLSNEDLIEYQQYVSYLSIMQDLIATGLSITECDSVTLQDIHSLMIQSSGVVSSYARNILETKGVMTYQEPWILPDGNSKSVKIRPARRNNVTKEVLRVFPNPADSYLIIGCPEGSGAGYSFEMIDSGGRAVRKMALDSGSDFHVMPVKDLPGGLYVGILRMNGVIAGATRIVIM